MLRQQRSLRSVIESISGELALRPLLTRIVHSACELLDAHHGTIGLVDEVRNVVRTEAVYRMPPDELGAEMGPGMGIAGEVLLKRRPVLLGRYGDIANPTQRDMLENTVLGMPIRWRGKMIGFFGIGRSAQRKLKSQPQLPRRFSRDDIATLETFARHAAIAIQNARQFALEKQRAERLSLITRVGRIITADLRLEELLQTAADAVHDILGYPNVAIPLLEAGNPDVLVIGTVGGDYRRIIHGEYRLPVTSGIMGEAARTGETILTNDVANDPRYVAVPGSSGIFAELAIPIMLGTRCLGVLNVESADRLTSGDATNLRIVADQLAVAIENARLHAGARELAVVGERHRLARDLHDSVTQLLFSMTLIAQSLAPAWQRDPDEGERRASRLLELSRAALGEMRALLAELRSAADAASRAQGGEGERDIEAIRTRGLPRAIRDFADELEKGALSIRIDGDRYRPLAARTETVLFRIAQEALHNVVKHAHASQARVRLSCTLRGTRLTIRDDGDGIVMRRPRARTLPQPSSAVGGMGLALMRERAEALGGSLTIARGSRKGTIVEVRIPNERARSVATSDADSR